MVAVRKANGLPTVKQPPVKNSRVDPSAGATSNNVAPVVAYIYITCQSKFVDDDEMRYCAAALRLLLALFSAK